MALADITLIDSQASPVSHVMTYTSTVNNRVIRSWLAAPPEAPETFSLAHTDNKVGGVKVKSHLVRLDKTVIDSDGITPYKCNIRLMVDIPDAIHSDALVDDLTTELLTYVDETNMRALCRGSVG